MPAITRARAATARTHPGTPSVSPESLSHRRAKDYPVQGPVHNEGNYLHNGKKGRRPGNILGSSNPTPEIWSTLSYQRLSASSQMSVDCGPILTGLAKGSRWFEPEISSNLCSEPTCPVTHSHFKGLYLDNDRFSETPWGVFGDCNPPSEISFAQERIEQGAGTDEDGKAVNAFIMYHVAGCTPELL